MKLQRLNIERESYGKDKGKLVGKITFSDDHGEVSIRLTEEHAHIILDVCADSLVATSQKIATEITANIIEASEDVPRLV